MGGKGPMADKGRKNGPMRLDRFLAEMGYGTRTQVKDMVKKGRVRMNGEAVDVYKRQGMESYYGRGTVLPPLTA